MVFFNSLIFNYANAVILTTDPDKIGKVIDDLKQLDKLFIELKNNYSQHLFNSSQGQNIIVNLGKDLKITPIAKNLFIILVKNGRLEFLPLICKFLPQLVGQRAGVYSAEVRSVRKLQSEELDDLLQKLVKIFDKKFEVENIIDPEMLGGISVRFDSFLLDNSIVNKLKKVKKYLSEYKLEYIR
jgi:ATP synthase F1 delta subunit